MATDRSRGVAESEVSCKISQQKPPHETQMSLIDRLNRLVRSNLNDLSSRAARRQVLGEVHENLREARSQLVECRLAERRLVEEYESLLDESYQWEERALLALKANDEPLARKALLRKHELNRRAAAIKEQLDSHRTYMTDLNRSLDAIDVKLGAIRDRRAQTPPPVGPTYKQQQSYTSPQLERQIQKTARLEAEAELGGLGKQEIFDEFDEMASKLDHAGAEIDALRELSTPQSGQLTDADALEKKFRKMENDRQLDRLKDKADDLKDLRRRLDEE